MTGLLAERVRELVRIIAGVIILVAYNVITGIASVVIQRGYLGNANTESAMSDFPDFLKKFIADKDFQLAHVKFPLKSIGVTKATWKSELSGAFNAEGFIYKESDNWYRYETNIEDVFFIAVFKKIDGQWYLTDAQYSVCGD
jgi:hypothetical protein